MIGAIAGDIIGSRFEGDLSPPRRFKLFHADCDFTDDTVCTLAVAAALTTDGDFGASLQRLARSYPDRGYGQMFEEWVRSERRRPYGSWGNGAPMRTSAVGWLGRSESEVRRLAARQAKATHNHPEAIAAAQAVSLAIFRLRRGAAPSTVRGSLEAEFGYDLVALPAKGEGFDASAIGTTQAALSAALNARGWIGAVRRVVDCGGDTDTLASITGAVAEAAFGVPQLVANQALTYLTDEMRELLRIFEYEKGRRP